MKKWVIKSGIQRKYLRYIMGLLLLAILLSSIGVWIYVRQSLTTEVTDKYEFLNEKMGLALDTLSKEADEGTKLHLQMWKRTLFRNILPI